MATERSGGEAAGPGGGRSGWRRLGEKIVGPVRVLIEEGDACVRRSEAAYEEGYWLDLRTEGGLGVVSLAIGPGSYAFLGCLVGSAEEV